MNRFESDLLAQIQRRSDGVRGRVLVACSGASFMTMMLTANATLQLNSAPERRGRVMAIYVIMFAGTTPFGGPLLGAICAHFGARAGTAVAGVSALAAAGALPLVRRSADRQAAERHALDRAGLDPSGPAATLAD